jgi:hypothetical protein
MSKCSTCNTDKPCKCDHPNAKELTCIDCDRVLVFLVKGKFDKCIVPICESCLDSRQNPINHDYDGNSKGPENVDFLKDMFGFNK